MISGDFVHHPVQLAEPDWAEVGDVDAALAVRTRRQMFTKVASRGLLVFGTHFPTHSVGRVIDDESGATWRFVAERPNASSQRVTERSGTRLRLRC